MSDIERQSRQVVISGATGFIGQHLIPLFLDKNYQVIATARNTEKARGFDWFRYVRFVSSDFHKDSTQIGVQPGAGLVHLAWQGLPDYQSRHHFEENLPFSYNFVKSLVNGGVRQVLVAGTCFEYGFKSGPIPSTARAQPENPYAVAKDCLRQYLEFLAREYPFKLQWARLFYMYGQGQSGLSLLSQLDSAIDRCADKFDMSGGEQLRDYLPIGEVVRQMLDLYESGRYGAFNICSGSPISIRNLVERRIEERGSGVKPNLGYYPYPRHEPMAFWGVRDIGETVYLPTLPNAPLGDISDKQSSAPVRLRYNPELDFLENEAFDSSLIDYTENYENSQAYSRRFREHMTDVLARLKAQLPRGSLIVEVGCGKGDFVELVLADGYFRIKGYDAAYGGGNDLIEKRYLDAADRIKADAIVLRHVLEHVPRPYEFLSMLKSIFGDAKIYIEVPNYDWIVEHKAFFDVTYEHVNYFSRRSLGALFPPSAGTHGLLFDGQYQFAISDLSSLNPFFDYQYKSGSWQYRTFGDIFPGMEREIERLDELAAGKSVFIWGAATKGCLFLAHCVSRKKLFDKVKFAIDVNPQKIGKYLPGSMIAIKSKADFFRSVESGDLLLIANPAYKSEIEEEVRAAALSGVLIRVL